MKKKIIDEFTDLPLSRERKRQLRLRRDNPEEYTKLLRRNYRYTYQTNPKDRENRLRYAKNRLATDPKFREWHREYIRQYQIKKNLADSDL